MSHNLVITNNKESEYVQFEVNIPDGYNKFRLEYLNGSVINQNYLRIGDVIKFTFDNNPIRYNVDKAKVKLIYRNADNTLPNIIKDDPTDYKFIDFNVFRYHQLVFIPVFQYYSDTLQKVIYIFNPCDTNMLYDEPVKSIPSILMQDNGSEADNEYAEFTSYYVMGFKPVDKIPEQTIRIGDSISNSRTRTQDMGAFQISNNVVNEVEVNTVTTNTYNYGSVWRYAVSNQVLKHTESILLTPLQNTVETKRLIIADDTNAGPLGITLQKGRIIEPTASQPESGLHFKYYSASSPKAIDITSQISLVQSVNNVYDTSFNPFIVQISEGKPINVSPSYSAIGSELDNDGIRIVEQTAVEPPTFTMRTIDYNDADSYIIQDWTYSVDVIRIRLVSHDGSEIVDNHSFVIGSPYFTAYELGELYNNNGTDFKIQLYMNGRWINKTKLLKYIIICDGTTSDDDGEIILGYKLLTGITNEMSVKLIADDDTHVSGEVLQLTGNADKYNAEDLYVEAIKDTAGVDGIRVSAKPMQNILHKIDRSVNSKADSALHPYTYTVTNYPCKWWKNNNGWTNPDPSDKPLQAFVPIKNNSFLTPFKDTNKSDGWFVITDVNDIYSEYISDQTCKVYIANGHETLNVEPPSDDDLKFKTFNGTLIFDRSNTKITRLFSNDLTGACLGYLNDLLAARLSRFYFISNMSVWNAFLNTKSQLTYTWDISFITQLFSNNELYTGYHETWLSNCQDIVKLIGSENVVHNCMDSLYPEEQLYPNCLVTYNKQYAEQSFPPDADTTPGVNLYYKFFHYYTAGLTSYPYAGTDTSDTSATTVGGLNLLYVPMSKSTDNNVLANNDKYTSASSSDRIMEKPIYIGYNRRDVAKNKREEIYDKFTDDALYYSNHIQDYGIIQTLPVFRIYRNSNFEQTDLTITTGGIKLLHPIYLQSTPRMLINNISYMFDCIIEGLLNKYGKIVSDDNKFGYLSIILQETYDNSNPKPTLIEHTAGPYPILRFGAIEVQKTDTVYVATSLDSMCLMNYLHMTSINEYQSIKELVDSLPTSENNEEVIKNMETNSMETNVQLFSSKYFNFKDEVSQFSMVLFNSSYVEVVPFNVDMLSYYWFLGDTDKDVAQNNSALSNMIQGYINNTMGYNNIKTCKVFITKLGEFLDFPRILYAGCDSYNNTMNVSVWNYNMTHYKSPVESIYEKDTEGKYTKTTTKIVPRPEQKINTYLFGVMFKYHQLAHGYQNFPNEITTDYIVAKHLGNRTFTIVLYDEYGRMFPNVDTNQGFKNNLYIELALE